MKLIGQASGTDTSTKVREKQLLTHQGQAAAFFTLKLHVFCWLSERAYSPYLMLIFSYYIRIYHSYILLMLCEDHIGKLS